MGTKRHMADHVREAITGLHPRGRVVDLFSGMGSVAESLEDRYSVVTNDALSFSAGISRARFTGASRVATVEDLLSRLTPSYFEQYDKLGTRFANGLVNEQVALSGDRNTLLAYMSQARHVGNDEFIADAALRASTDTSHQRYCLASLYFSAGYFSLRQAIEIDAIRYAIDTLGQPEEIDWLLGAWLVSIAALVNAPGHTAQYLKPNSDRGYARILGAWQRSVWTQFQAALRSLRQVGSMAWRTKNQAFVGDALNLVCSDQLQDVGVFYADPPYTKDQYSRYYHVYETLYRYDFPASTGAGRYRSNRFVTSFSLKRSIVESFHRLFVSVAERQVPLVLSYPNQGLLTDAGEDVWQLAREYFSDIEVITIAAQHSTMGASKGTSRKLVTEHLYVCQS